MVVLLTMFQIRSNLVDKNHDNTAIYKLSTLDREIYFINFIPYFYYFLMVPTAAMSGARH